MFDATFTPSSGGWILFDGANQTVPIEDLLMTRSGNLVRLAAMTSADRERLGALLAQVASANRSVTAVH